MNGYSMSAAASMGLYCALVFLASLAGGWILLAIHLVHSRLQIAVSFVAGLMLGMALLHFIPHSFHQQHSLDQTVGWALAGFLVMFFLQRFFHYHHHDVSNGTHAEHSHAEHETPEPEPRPSTGLSWVGVALGLSLHSLLDGLAMGAAVAADARGHGGILGLGAALAVILHKPFDAMAISTLMTAAGCSRALRHLVNVLFGLLSPLGALAFFFGTSHISAESAFVGWALAFCAGTFLCIACTDLLPELQFHSHDRLKLSVALLAGIGVAILIGQFESSGHDHSAPTPTQTQAMIETAQPEPSPYLK
jgi:zinc and cadmium transporter